jgi:hypothetical protein
MVSTGLQQRELTTDGTPEFVRWLPAIPTGPADLDGRTTHHCIVATGQHTIQEVRCASNSPCTADQLASVQDSASFA